MSNTEALPELPAPDYWSTRDDDTPLFTADQMREYARAALAQPAATVQQVPAAWRYKDSSRICDNSDGRMTAGPGWVPLYAAPRA